MSLLPHRSTDPGAGIGNMDPLKELASKGLYSPEQEHDACGVGMVADIKGRKSHQIIEEGLQVLVNLGRCGQ